MTPYSAFLLSGCPAAYSRQFFQFAFLFLVMFFIGRNANGQGAFFSENFEHNYTPVFKQQEDARLRLYVIRTHAPREKSSLNIYSDRTDSMYGNYYIGNPCNEAGGRKGFYAGINLYTKEDSDDRELLVMVLDSALDKKARHAVSLDVKFHHCCRYRVDSLQVMLLETEADIKLFLKGRKYKGVYKDLSLEAVDNKDWKHLSTILESGGAWKYMIIGNVDSDKESGIIRQKPCNCTEGKRGWKYSEIFLDDITIAEEK